MSTYFVMVPVKGRTFDWPEDPPVRMRYKEYDNMACGWVRSAQSPEDAVLQFLDMDANLPPGLQDEIHSRLDGPARVAVLSEVVEIPL